MNNTPQKALVLGGKTGLLGQALVKSLEEAGWQVESLGRDDMNAFGSTMADKANKLQEFVDKLEPNCLFNTLAYTQVDLAETHESEAMLVNAKLPSLLGRIVKERPTQLIHYSTDFVFSGSKRTPYSTDDAPDPQSVYGKSKLAGEEALRELDLPRCLILRTAWLFGPGRKNFVSTILRICQEHGSARVVHDQVGSPSYTVDVAKYTLKLLEFDATGLFHVVNAGQASWCEFAEEAVRYSQLECAVTPIPSNEYPQPAPRPAYSVLDTSRFTKVTGLTPRPWPQALRECLLRAEIAV